ncbi:hypothetical protein ASPBRDRAFT_39719 [Aspergillus brasiliensis CBS 101740]|uniref:Uncharacterized protein n=1 Tax=Aspergillus brasiliensis (strain CBS 101740 / IMI 381727 / IBT 21946) TaxID=767769 RepID=A0A1L9US82_ASPBC|nr:hypothetical protein ASPBRDRAFT_39719 [Aspergillus brasiliensis CBS 101740]
MRLPVWVGSTLSCLSRLWVWNRGSGLGRVSGYADVVGFGDAEIQPRLLLVWLGMGGYTTRIQYGARVIIIDEVDMIGW